MTGRWRRLPLVAAALAVASLTAGCGEADDDKEDLRAAIQRTERLARNFVYTEESSGRSVEVKGLREDDFRFKATLAVDDRTVLEQVVDDDALAVRFSDPAVIPEFLENPPAAAAETDVPGISVLQALQSRRWVSDPEGAPPTTTTAEDFDDLGVDPVRDALTVLAYTDRAVGESFAVRRFNPDALDYKPSEDPFPTPEDGSGIDRYDLLAYFLPRPEAIGQQGGGGALPGVRNFRKMSVYVEDGLVIRIAERIAAEGDIADRMIDYTRVFLEETDPAQRRQFDAALASVPEGERSDFLLLGLNTVREDFGEDPVRPRDMAVDFVDIGASIEVEYPDDVITGSLAALAEPDGEDEAGAGPEGGADAAGQAPVTPAPAPAPTPPAGGSGSEPAASSATGGG